MKARELFDLEGKTALITGSSGGLGTVISNASSMNQLAVVYAAIGVLAVMGSLLMLVITVIERRALHWHESSADRT